MIAKDIQKLSDMLRTATDFSEVQSAFFDLSESSDLLSHGGPWRSEAVEKAVGACVASMVPGTTAMDLFLVRIPEFGFAHGSLVVEGRMGTVIYFEKTQMGLVTLGTPGSNECNLARFTASRPMQGASLN